MDPSHERFAAANNVLRGFLHRLTRDAEIMESARSVSEAHLRLVSEQLSQPVSQAGEASHSVALDEYLQREIAEYVRNFRALQEVLEKVHYFVATRKL